MNAKKTHVVSVVLNRPLFKSFDYVVDNSYDIDTLIGRRVEVSFGHGSNKDIGIIVEHKKQSKYDFAKLKEATIIDDFPITTKDVVKTILFASSYYHYPIGQCFSTLLAGLLKTKVSIDKPKESCLCLNENIEDKKALRSAKAQELLAILKESIDEKELVKNLQIRGFGKKHMQMLVDKELAHFEDITLDNYVDTTKEDFLKEKPFTPNTEQQYAIDRISDITWFKIFLLNGITGSGKTEVYLQVIERVLKRGKRVLVLIPEIALTPQTLARFYNRFKVNISIINSSLTQKERLNSHINMLHGLSNILIGTRSALFTPIDNLGLIVIDEEHDLSFKQQEGFKYHARSLAIIRAQHNDCPIILGSATPSLESVYNCLNDKFEKIDLTTRAGFAKLPNIELIDLKTEPFSEGLKTGISNTLEDRIGYETAKGNQVLLFLNRRGFSRHLECHSCGHIFNCKHCDIPLTVHKKTNTLSCHICDHNEEMPYICPVCHSSQLTQTGFGTEKVEEFLKLRYPDAGIERIDRDTVRSKDELEKMLERVKSKQSKILLGTQILAKGHDFPDVTLVGIIDIDSGLFSDDFRSAEYTLQLATQVAGRAGRATKEGSVIIQTNHLEHRLIQDIKDNNKSYFEKAYSILQDRQQKMLPPFTYQAYLHTSSNSRENAHAFLTEVYLIMNNLQCACNVNIGPVLPDKIEKRNDKYYFHILLSSKTRECMSLFLESVLIIVEKLNPSANIKFSIEVDPINMY